MLAFLTVPRIKRHYWTFVYSWHASPRLHGGQCRCILLVSSYLEKIFHFRNTTQILTIVPVLYCSFSQHNITVDHKMALNRFSERWVSFHTSVWWQHEKTSWLLKCAIYAFGTYGSSKMVLHPIQLWYAAEHFYRMTRFSIQRCYLVSMISRPDGPWLLFVGNTKSLCLPCTSSNEWVEDNNSERDCHYYKRRYTEDNLAWFLRWTNVLLVKVTWKTLFF
jgi:hypothetical protein